jgi:Putative beta-barrel porin-2, OmpL-like. bbp2
MRNNFTYTLLLITLLFSTAAFAQDAAPEEKKEEPTFSLAGSVDTYFHSSFKTINPYMGGSFGPSSSFADLRGFSLGMVNLIASYQGEKSGFVGDLVFGPRGKAAVFGTASGQAIINQLYAYYKLGDHVTFNLGQFNTFLGYEVISPAINFHYSTSYLFSWGPFNHTGLRADFDFGGGFVGKLAIMNPTDIVEFNPVNTYTLGAQIGKSGDGGSVYLNFLYGDQDGTLDESDPNEDGFSAGTLFQGDITASVNLGETFSLGINASYQTTAAGEAINTNGDVVDLDGDASSFFGVALYPKLTLSENFSLGLRGEYFAVKKSHLNIFTLDDFDAINEINAGDGSVVEFTLSANYKVGGLMLIPEFRIDKTSEDSFIDKDDKATDLMATFSFAAVYKF